MLWTLTQQQLSATCFPLGRLSKEEIRAIALEQAQADSPSVRYQKL